MQEKDIILKKISRLSKPLKQEALDFIDFLAYKKNSLKKSRNSSKPLNFDWENALFSLKSQYTSLELQKKSLEWC
jgi:hypothetical protein